MISGTWVRPHSGRRFHFAPRDEGLCLCGVHVLNTVDERAGVGEAQACTRCTKMLAKMRAGEGHADPQE